MTATFLGNITNIFDCEKLISQVQKSQGELHCSNIDLPHDNYEYENHLQLKQMSRDAGYDNNDSMRFKHYKPGRDFDTEFVNIFCKFVNAKPLVVFVSEITPGKCAPWHWDIDQYELENAAKGELVRYHVHLSKPAPGHVFIIDDRVFYNESQGNTYQWHNRKSWHAGTNCGMSTKYLFAFKGYK
jgi:hypothetical protein